MTLLTYQVFKTVSEVGSFHKTAQILGLTPSAISHAVSAMENELGFPVFTRSKSGVTLTNSGEQLLPFVNAVLNSDETLKQEIAELKGLRRGKVKIGCFASVCTTWIPGIIKSMEKKYPAIEIEIFQGTYDDVRYWIKNGIVDLGFLSASSAGDLDIVPLYRDPLLCIVPKEFEKENRNSDRMTIDEMSHLKFVVQRESTDADVQKYLKDNQLRVDAGYHVVDDLSTIAMVANGFGICIMPELTMQDIPYEVRRYRMDPDASRLIGLASLNAGFMAPSVRILYQEITEKFSNL